MQRLHPIVMDIQDYFVKGAATYPVKYLLMTIRFLFFIFIHLKFRYYLNLQCVFISVKKYNPF